MEGRFAQDVECLIRAYPLALHQDPFSLPEDLSGAECSVKLVEPTFLVLVGVGNREGKTSQ
jgi:hypothetical protein